MRNFKLFALCFVALSMLFVGCKKDDKKDPVSFVVDGFYVSGDATAFATLDEKGLMQATTVENKTNSPRVGGGLYEIYVALEAGKPFTITEVSGSTKTVYGSGLETIDQNGVQDEKVGVVYKGTYAAGGTYSVATNGLYQIVVDQQTKSICVIPVDAWGIIGGATPLGWGGSTVMAQKGDFNKDSLVFEATEVTMLSGTYKFRHSMAWKQTILDSVGVDTLKVNTNFGGTLDALVPGGTDITWAGADKGVYTVKAVWKKGAGMSFSFTKTGDVVSLWPDNLYINGGDFGGATWDWTSAGIVTMTPVNSHPYAFWAIVYCSAASEFKFAPEKAWGADFGVTAGSAVDGIYTKGSANVAITDAGYYMVYVDLQAEKISVTAPTVYGMGDAFGGWTADVAANLFTVDNVAKKITSPATTAAGNVRMYATCPLSQQDAVPALWWQMEFNVIDGAIALRGIGGDQAAVPVTAGQTVALDFSAGTGTIQ